MSIITISRGSYSRGKEVAEKVARKLGYECLARDVVVEAARDFNIPEIRLIRAIHDAPSILDKFMYGREKYIAYVQQALLHHFRRDNVVYHGLAGHFFVRDIPHVLKVRILAEMEDRVKLEMERQGITAREARRLLESDDIQRKRWSQNLYGIDTWDPRLYDVVLHIKKISVDDAVDIICHTVKLDDFRTTPESRQKMESLAIAADIKAALVELKPDVEVRGEAGIFHVTTTVPESMEVELVDKIEKIASGIPGVREVKVHTRSSVPYDD